MLAFQYQPNAENPFVRRVYTTTTRKSNPPVEDEAPIFWIFSSGDAALYALVGEKLPPGHAMISQAARQRTIANGQRVYNAYFSEWFSRNNRDSTLSMQFEPTEKEREDLTERLRRAMAPYWLAPQTDFSMGSTGSRPLPYCIAVRRDGKPAQFRGTEVSGSRDIVMKMLKDHAHGAGVRWPGENSRACRRCACPFPKTSGPNWRASSSFSG